RHPTPRATSQTGHRSSPRPRAMHDKAYAGVNPCERRRSGHSRPAKSFKTPHPLDIIQVLYFLECRQIGEVDPGHRAASSFADGGQDTLALCSFLSARHHQPEPILNEGSERASLCSSLAFGALKQTFGKSDSGSLHMSRHIMRTTICQRG